MLPRMWLIIGISGPTCSGKSSLAKEIHRKLRNSVLLQQDDYFLDADDPRHIIVPELNHQNWELPTCIDMQKMYSDIFQLLECSCDENHSAQKPEKRVLILEGFLLFEFKTIIDLCDLKYFIRLTKEQCWERRKARAYNPPDVPGYFEKIVWPEYVKHESKITKDEHLRTTIKFIDGTKTKEEIFQSVFAEIIKLLC